MSYFVIARLDRAIEKEA